MIKRKVKIMALIIKNFLARRHTLEVMISRCFIAALPEAIVDSRRRRFE